MSDSVPARSPFVPFCGKVGHPSRTVALANLWRVQKYLISKSKDLSSLAVYRCDYCPYFHIGNTADAAPVAKPRVKRRRPSDARRKACEYDREGADG